MRKKGNLGITLLITLFLLIFFGIFIKSQYSNPLFTGFATYNPDALNITYEDPTPTDGNVTTASQVTIKISTAVNAAYAWLEWDGQNESMQGANKNWHIDKTGTGAHTYRAYANDSQDNYGATAQRTITLGAPPPAQTTLNFGPIPNQTIQEDSTLTLNLTTYLVTNQNNPTYSVSAVDQAYASCAITSTSILNCTLVKDRSGTTTLAVQASASSVNNQTTFTLIIIPVNDPPNLIKNFTNITFTTNESVTLNLSTYYNDIENDNITFSATLGPGLNVNMTLTLAILSALNNYTGTTNVTFIANDSMNLTSTTAPVLVTSVRLPLPEEKKDPPIPNQEWDKNTVHELNLEPHFTRAGTNIQYSVKGLQNIAVTFNGHVASIKPNDNWHGSETVTFTATGSNGAFDSNPITLTVRDTQRPPELKNQLPALTLTKNQTEVTINLNEYFTDPDNEPLSYNANSSHADIHTSLQSAQLTITFAKKSTTLKTAEVKVKATDPNKQSAEGTISIVLGEDLQRKEGKYGIPFFLAAIAFIAILIVGGYRKIKTRPLSPFDEEKKTKTKPADYLKNLFTPTPKSDRYKKEALQTAEIASVLATLVHNCDDRIARSSLSHQRENLAKVQRLLTRDLDTDGHRHTLLTLKETRGALYEIKSITRDNLLKEELDHQLKSLDAIIKNVNTKSP